MGTGTRTESPRAAGMSGAQAPPNCCPGATGPRATVLQSWWWGWTYGSLPNPSLQPGHLRSIIMRMDTELRARRSCAQASSKRLAIAFLRTTLTSAGWLSSSGLVFRVTIGQDWEATYNVFSSSWVSRSRTEMHYHHHLGFSVCFNHQILSLWGDQTLLSFLIMSTSFKHCYILLQNIRATDCQSRISGNKASPIVPPLANKSINALI